jgi:hypothetical protein
MMAAAAADDDAGDLAVKVKIEKVKCRPPGTPVGLMVDH